MTDTDADDTSFREFTKNLFESWFIFEALHDFRVFFRIFCGNRYRDKSCHRGIRRAFWLGFCLFHKAEKWEAHVDRYSDLAGNDHGNGVTRLDYMASALNLLDSKFSSLLQFNGLLLAASALAVQLIVQRPSFRLPALSFGLFWLSLLGGLALWIWTFYLCMRGQAEVLWGDMWEVADPTVAERREVRQMIGATIMRTARMRMAVVMTMVVGYCWASQRWR